MTPDINRARANEVVRRLLSAFRDRRGLLENVDDLVENQIPSSVERLSEDHARFLFYTVVHDHGMKSRNLYARAKALFFRQPDLFSPQRVVSDFAGPDDALLKQKATQTLGVRYPRGAARTWYLNSLQLLEKFDGTVKNVFASSSSAPALLRTVMSFRGYGRKTGGMLLRAIAGLGFCQLSDLESVEIPVDIHDSRISFLTGVITTTETSEDIDYYKYSRLVRQELTAACRRLAIEWPDVDRALWLIGSRGCVKRACRQCPLSDICTVGQGIVGSTLPGLH